MATTQITKNGVVKDIHDRRLPSSLGNPGQALVVDSSGNSIIWGDASGGTVTKVETGTGLSGGPITTSGTISVDTTIIATKQDLTSKQDVIDSSNKLSADLIASGFTNKVVTQDEKNTWSSKQNAITSTNKLSSDLVDDNGHTNRFVTAGEKVTWTNKQNALNEYNKLNADYIKDGDTNKVVTQSEKTTWDSKSSVSVSDTGTATDTISYITVNGTEKKLAGGDITFHILGGSD